jgi:PBP1b-binding outer membrane lipoprotein LpoB
MNENSVKWVGYLLSFALLIISCAGTEVTQKQVDDAYKGKPVSDILVIAVTGNEHNRRSYEKKFVAHLKSAGVDAIASEEVMPMPADLKLKTETIVDAVNQYENDAVIITQLIGKESKDIRTRGPATRMGFFYYSLDPGYSSTSTTVRLETNLYDAKTGKLIWTGNSKTLSSDSTDQIMNEIIKTVINSLKIDKVIAPK